LRGFLSPQLHQLALKDFDLHIESLDVIGGQAIQGALHFLYFLLEMIDSPPVGLHALLVLFLHDKLYDIGECLFDIVPGRVQIGHKFLQARHFPLADTDIVFLFYLEIIEVVTAHPLNHLYLLVVEVIQQFLLLPVVILDGPWVLLFELCLRSDDFLHEFCQFVVSLVVRVSGVVRDGLLLVFGRECLLSGCGIDAIDSEALAGGLRGAYSAVVHILIFDVDDVLSLLVFVRLVLAEVLTSPLRILLGLHSLGRVVSGRRSDIPRRARRTDHRFPSIGHSIGRAAYGDTYAFLSNLAWSA
jgi:hypothetical protein